MKVKVASADISIESVKAIIVNRAVYHYRTMSTQIQRRVDLEDWISHGICFYCTTFVNRARKRFDASKANYNTYVWQAFNNFYRQAVWDASFKHMHASTASIEDLAEGSAFEITDEHSEDFVAAMDAVRRVRELHARASVELVTYLDRHFFSGKECGRFIVKGKHFKEKQQEFMQLANRLGVTIDDYRLAIKAHHSLPAHYSMRK